MTRAEMIRESERIFGFVSGFIEQGSEKWSVPVWGLVRDLLIRESSIPRKYKAMIALGTAFVLHGRYTSFAFREYTRAIGVSDKEVQEVIAGVANNVLWDTWMSGISIDMSSFEKGYRQMIEGFSRLEKLPARGRLETRSDVLKEFQAIFGVIPEWFDSLPDTALKHMWQLNRTVGLEEDQIPSKYLRLIGLAAASVIHCRPCIMDDTAGARLSGASDIEIKEAILLGALVRSLEVILEGLYYDRETFMKECIRMIDRIRIPGSSHR